jgi:DNA-binding transcriptional ArsR family regulator
MPRKTYGQSPPKAARLFHALGHEPRVRVPMILAGRGETSVGDLGAAVGLTHMNASQQLGVLRRAGLAVCRRDGKRVLYRLSSPVAADVLRLACGP